MKLSIIIPVYNVEKYVLRCLDSCYRQDLPESDYEVICVDDGSTDNSSSLIETFAKKHNNIVVLHQSNAGQSAARNYGLKKAKGDYIWFIDSDDWIQPNVIKRLLIQAYQENLDTLCFTFQYADENGEITKADFTHSQDAVKITTIDGNTFSIIDPDYEDFKKELLENI